MNSSFTLDSFHFTNYKGIKSCSIAQLPHNAKWIFLTGENGYGKTSSAIPLLGAPAHSIILNVQRNTIDGITVERLTDMEKQLSNLLPNIILSSPIFCSICQRKL